MNYYPKPQVWLAQDMKDDQSWKIELSKTHVQEVLSAVATLKRRGIPIQDITRANFRLGTLEAVLQMVHRDVVCGRGFALLRGLPVEDLSREDVVRAYFGISSYLGTAVPQNCRGHLVGHVKNIGHDPKLPHTRIYATNYRQPFHVDSSDIVGLLCLRTAKSGGASAICSSISVFREIEKTRPDLAVVLEQPFFYDRKNEVPDGKGPYYQIPIAHKHDGWLTIYYARDFINAAQARFNEIPRLTEAQIEALDLMDALATDPRFRLDMNFREGDIQFLHNHQLLHARTEYEDWSEPERMRHLIRIWLAAHDDRPLPSVFEERYGKFETGKPRGGIRLSDVSPTTPLEAE